MIHNFIRITSRHSICRLSAIERARINFRQMVINMTQEQKEMLAKAMVLPKRNPSMLPKGTLFYNAILASRTL